MFLKLTRLNDSIEGKEIGTVLLDPQSIEAIEEFNHSLHKGSLVRLKPVISGFLGDDDRIYRTQVEYDVAETCEEIELSITKL
jgi:hypothetical protein